MRAAAPLAALLLIACETAAVPEALGFLGVPQKQEGQGTVIRTIPDDALLSSPSGSCRTPCRVAFPGGVAIELAKEGYRPVRLFVPEGAADALFELEPVGRSTAVEETILPAL